MSKFTKIADFKLPELPYRMVKGDYDFSKQAVIDGNVKMLKSIKKVLEILLPPQMLPLKLF